MRWLRIACSFLFVAAGVFFIAGWCLLPAPTPTGPEASRWERLELLGRMDWAHNWWGYALGGACGLFSLWLTIRKSRGQSAP